MADFEYELTPGMTSSGGKAPPVPPPIPFNPRTFPTITTPDGVVHINEELLRLMNPEQRETYNAFIEAYRVDPSAIGADAVPRGPELKAPSVEGPTPQNLPGTPILPEPAGDASGKRGTDDNIYKLLGTLAPDGISVITPDGERLTQLPPDVAYDPVTKEFYHIPPPALDRATFIPLAKRAGGGIEFAMPQAIQGALDAIDRAVERQRRGLIVADSVLNREAIEVAGMASSGSFGMAQANRVARQMVREAAPAPGAVRRLVGAPNNAPDPVTPLAPGFQLGTAGLGSPPTPPKPPRPRPVLDSAGFYSQAEKAALEVLPPRAPGTDMLGIMTSQRGRVAEAEIRDMNLDVFLLGDEVATARRELMTLETRLSDKQRRLQELQTEPLPSSAGAPPAVAAQHAAAALKVRQRKISVHEDDIMDIRQQIAASQKKLAKIQAANPPSLVTREAIAEYAREHRIRLAQTVYETPQYDSAIIRDISLVESRLQRAPATLARTLAQRARVSHTEAIEAIGTVLNALTREGLTPIGMKQALDSVAIEYPELLPYIRREITQIAGRPVDELTVSPTNARPTTYSQSTIDPRNRTNREIVLRIDAPAAQEAMRILESMPRFDARVIAWMEGQTVDDMRGIGLSSTDIHEVLNARGRHPREVTRLRTLAQQGAWLGGHFVDPAWTGMAMTSVQELADGRIALFLNQLQSDWTNALNASPTRTTTKNVLVSNLTRWVDPMLRRVLREAVESGADVVIVPNGATVQRYNDLPDSIQRLYNQIYPRRMASVMREIDSTVPKAGKIIQGSEMNRTPLAGNVPMQTLSGPLGQMFEVTPAIREHFRSGGGSRLLSGSGDDPLAAVAAGTLAEALRRRGVEVTDIGAIGPRARHPKTPVLAYHGTPYEFDRFRSLDKPSRSGIGHHFGTQEQANEIVAGQLKHQARNASMDPRNIRVIPAVLDVRNPITLRDAGGWDPASTLIRIRQALRRRSETPQEIMDRLDNMLVAYNRRLNDRQEHAAFNQIYELLEDLGYDSIRYSNVVEGKGWSYIIWQQGQAISATNRSHRLFSGAPAPVGMENHDGAAPTAD